VRLAMDIFRQAQNLGDSCPQVILGDASGLTICRSFLDTQTFHHVPLKQGKGQTNATLLGEDIELAAVNFSGLI